MPLFHIHGLIGVVLSSIVAGSCVVCTPGFDADRFFTWMQVSQPSWYSAVPTMHQSIFSRLSQRGDHRRQPIASGAFLFCIVAP